jgi:Ca2+-binding RTX toxin-like protein
MATILGTSRNENLSGGNGPDTIYGLGGSDVIHGGASNDVLYGDDAFSFFGGNDRLYGGAGNDVITGGKGTDRYYFGLDSGNDVVTDLNPSEGDKIILLGVTYSDVRYHSDTQSTTLYFTPEGNDRPGEDTVTFTNATEADVLRALGAYDLIG